MHRAFSRISPDPHCFYEILTKEAVDPVYLILDLERGFSAAEAANEATLQQAREDTWGAIVRITEQLLSELCGGGDIRLMPGFNCQVLESVYTHKVLPPPPPLCAWHGQPHLQEVRQGAP